MVSISRNSLVLVPGYIRHVVFIFKRHPLAPPQGAGVSDSRVKIVKLWAPFPMILRGKSRSVDSRRRPID